MERPLVPVFGADPHDPVAVRAGDAEQLPEIGHCLLADASASNGALTASNSPAVPTARSRTGTTTRPNRSSSSTEKSGCLWGRRSSPPAPAVEAMTAQPTTLPDAAARQACAALLRRPVDVPRNTMTVDTQATETVTFLQALLTADALVDVSPDDLGPDRAQPAGAVLMQMQLNPPADAGSARAMAQPTAESTPDQTAIQPAADPDRAALLASGPLPALVEGIALHLLAMAEDTHDMAPSRTQAIDALRLLTSHLPGPVLRHISDRMTTVSRNAALSQIDRLTLEASGAFSRARLDLGITHLPGMALALATDAFVKQRDRQSPLAAHERASTDEVVASSAALMRDPGAELRKLGAIALHDLAYDVPDAAIQACGMLFHPDPQVRVLGARVAPLTAQREALLANDPAPEVRQALSDRLSSYPRP
jgi:hypothetical protein